MDKTNIGQEIYSKHFVSVSSLQSVVDPFDNSSYLLNAFAIEQSIQLNRYTSGFRSCEPPASVYEFFIANNTRARAEEILIGHACL
jgi:hypothetical protein